jgi:hypothetical protein
VCECKDHEGWITNIQFNEESTSLLTVSDTLKVCLLEKSFILRALAELFEFLLVFLVS